MNAPLHPFHVNLWPASIIRVEDYVGSASVCLSWDGRVDDAEKKRVIAAWVKALPTFRQITRLRVWSHVTQPLFDAICALTDLTELQLKWSNVRSLGNISQLTKLRCLSIGSSTKIESIDPLGTLANLEFLELENVKLIRDFAPLNRLLNLRDLAVTGSLWSRQDVGSLAVFARMTWLDALSVDTSQVGSIQELAALTRLKQLHVGGRLPFQEYAWLAAKLPATQCRWFRPYFELADTGYSPCKRCRNTTLVMVTGKGKPILCKDCDAAKLAKHVAQFELARASVVGA